MDDTKTLNQNLAILDDTKSSILNDQYVLILKILNELFNKTFVSLTDFKNLQIKDFANTHHSSNTFLKHSLDIRKYFGVTFSIHDNRHNNNYIKFMVMKLLSKIQYSLVKKDRLYCIKYEKSI